MKKRLLKPNQKTYRVVVRQVHAFPYLVNASSKKDAIKQVIQNCNGVEDEATMNDNWESYLETCEENPVLVEVVK